MKYAEVILPLPLENTYTYRIPEEMEASVRANFRVIVPFGKKRFYTAIVRKIHAQAPETHRELKDILAPLDGEPVLSPLQPAFWEWMASYYLCKPGDVYRAAVPSGLRLESRELERLTAGGKESIGEALRRRLAPKTETWIRLAAAYRQEAHFRPLFEQLCRTKLQEKLLLAFREQARPFLPQSEGAIARKKLLEAAGVSASVLEALLKRGVLATEQRETGEALPATSPLLPPHPLTAAQQTACDGIRAAFAEKAVCLLHGAPSSGKTEIYLHLALEMLQQGRQVLYLLPEIAVTTHITARLARVLGERLLVWHSACSEAERLDVWRRLLHDRQPVLTLGVRSALFLPFGSLGLVIVDEEHEPSYRQADPAPRYHARNAAIMLAAMHGAKTLLGSATPSLDSYLNARTGKYGRVTLSARFGAGLAPRIHLVNVKELKRRKIMKHALFSPLLQEKISEALADGGQVILFRNRRGFAPVMECQACGKAVRCVQCDVSLTFHRQARRLVCHYCGHSSPLPARCPSCNAESLRCAGFGTEQVEEEIAALFPGAKTARLDVDTARTRKACERILADFEEGRTQMLVGTQMLSKGMDFGRVQVVGVLDADGLMNAPDFRAYERAFQLMMQVGGRAGRRERQGAVIIQTSQPEHPLLQALCAYDYESMVHTQLAERQVFYYPPCCRMITLIFRSRREDALCSFAQGYAAVLRQAFGERVSGPFAPAVNRIQAMHLRHIVLKIERTLPAAGVRSTLDRIRGNMQAAPEARHVVMYYDVDN